MVGTCARRITLFGKTGVEDLTECRSLCARIPFLAGEGSKWRGV